MPANVHRIRRQRWVVRAGSPEEAFAIRQYLREHSPELLEPALQAAFDEAADAATVLHLPKLELHVRVASLAEMATALPGRVAEQLRELLPPNRTAAVAPGAKSPGRMSTTPEFRWEQLLHYLTTGQLPWEGADEAPGDAARRLRETWREQPARLHRWLEVHPVPADFFLRLFPLVSVDELADWVATGSSRLGADESAVMVALIRHMLEDRATAPTLHVRRQLAAGVLQNSHGSAGSGDPADLVTVLRRVLEPRELREFVAACPPTVRAWIRLQHGDEPPGEATVRAKGSPAVETGPASGPRNKTFSSAEGSVNADGASSTRPERVEADAGTVPADGAESKRTGADVDRNRSSVSGDPAEPKNGVAVDRPNREPGVSPGGPRPPRGDTREAAGSGLPHPPGERSAAAPEPDEGGGGHPDLVPQAGLILLHPFLPRLFERLDLKDPERGELRAGGVERAGAILHWLATAGKEVFEFELGFIKVLLGLTPRTPLHVSPDLVTAKDREEVESLLRSVIEHWAVLRTTSPNGLRAAFLERAGLLTDGGDDWKLRVERRGIDVLVDQLPWSISVVKLPWAAKPIFATW